MNKEKHIIKLLEAMLELFRASVKESGFKQTLEDKSYILGIKDSIITVKEYEKI